MGLQIILVSVSGVFSPGPLLFANLALSKYGGFWSGIKIAVGHTIIELPLIILLSLPFVVLFPINLTFSTTKIITFIAGAFLIIFGILYVVRIIRTRGSPNSPINTSRIENPYLAGIMFTSLNPFFIVWWTTVGVKLISDSISLLGHPVWNSFSIFCAYMDGLCLARIVFIPCLQRLQYYTIRISQIYNYIVNSSSFLLRYLFYFRFFYLMQGYYFVHMLSYFNQISDG